MVASMYYVYVLKSKISRKSYVGFTNNLNKRLAEHNNGKSNYTSKNKPWEIVHMEKFRDKTDAIKKEKYLKSAAGRRYLKKNIFRGVD